MFQQLQCGKENGICRDAIWTNYDIRKLQLRRSQKNVSRSWFGDSRQNWCQRTSVSCSLLVCYPLYIIELPGSSLSHCIPYFTAWSSCCMKIPSIARWCKSYKGGGSLHFLSVCRQKFEIAIFNSVIFCQTIWLVSRTFCKKWSNMSI